MGFSRLPRFKRAAAVPPIQLTERDRLIIRHVHRHRFLRSSHIAALIGGSSQPVFRRLQLLYHNAFLERPRAQIDYFRHGGSHHIVYGLGNKGAALLREENRVPLSGIRWSEKNRSVGRIFFEHTLLVSEILVVLELACRKRNGVRLVGGDDLQVSDGVSRAPPLKWSVNVKGRGKLGIRPDRAFALDIDDHKNGVKRAYFFLEADRGTMPVSRGNVVQSSFFRKLLAYEATWATGLHRSQFGFNRFRVLTVTNSASRLKSLVTACSKLKTGHGLFLFSDHATLKRHGDILTVPWQNGRGETVTLLT